MDKIEVTARFDIQGDIIPLNFTWKGKTHPIMSVGRNWKTEDGYHILVMNPEHLVFHLIFKPGSSRWFLVKTNESPVSPFV